MKLLHLPVWADGMHFWVMVSLTLPRKDESPHKQLMSLGEQLGSLMLLRTAVCILLSVILLHFISNSVSLVITHSTSDQVGRLGGRKLSGGTSEGNDRDEVAHVDSNRRDMCSLSVRFKGLPAVYPLRSDRTISSLLLLRCEWRHKQRLSGRRYSF